MIVINYIQHTIHVLSLANNLKCTARVYIDKSNLYSVKICILKSIHSTFENIFRYSILQAQMVSNVLYYNICVHVFDMNVLGLLLKHT